jgi:uncharacterized damage-inducible protein DinB
MATTSDLLADGFDRIRDLVRSIASGLDEDQLATRLEDRGNSIAWLLWHLLRVQDDHIAELADTEQQWTADGWADRFALPFDDTATGYGHSFEEVGQVRASADNLIGYAEAVHEQSVRYVRGLGDADLDEVVDQNWDPPVTRAVRLVSVLSDDLQHAGQAAFVRGLIG